MKIKVNGKEQEIEGQTVSIHDLLKQNAVKSPDMVTVQVNGKFVSKEEFENFTVTEGDEVEFLYFMGGGGD
jgi:sulfur carrier protein